MKESSKIILILFCIMATLGCCMAENLDVENLAENLGGFKYGPRFDNALQVKKDEYIPYEAPSPIAISPEGESYFISRRDHEDHKDKHHKHKHKKDCGASTTMTGTMLGVASILVTFLWFL